MFLSRSEDEQFDTTDATGAHVGKLCVDGIEDPSLAWPMNSARPYVFFSQTERDDVKRSIVLPTHWFLTRILKVDAFLDEKPTHLGVHKTRALIEPAYRCTHALVLLSPRYRERKVCIQELNTFMARWRRRDGIRVLPALWLIDNVDGYHTDVDDLLWLRPRTRDSVQYMIHSLWPALFQELMKHDDAEMSTTDYEEYLCSYVEQNQSNGDQITKDLNAFAREHRLLGKAVQEPALQKARKSAKDAIVYLPGLLPFHQEEEIAYILACSLATKLRESEAKIQVVKADTSYKYGERKEWQCEKYMIYREGRPIVDLYWMEYEQNFKGKPNALFVDALQCIWHSCRLVSRFLKLSYEHCVLGRESGVHVFNLWIPVLSVPLFFGIACIIYEPVVSATFTFPARLSDLVDASKPLIPFTFLPTFALVFLPSRWIDALKRCMALCSGIMKFYLPPWGGEIRERLRQQFQLLLERIQNQHSFEESENPYDAIHIVACCFGSLIAIETLFPPEKPPPTIAFDRVRRLVTIGCPFDLVRTMLPAHYGPRILLVNNLFWSTNIFIPQDFMSSNFRNDTEDAPGVVGVPTDGDDILPCNQFAYENWDENVGFWAHIVAIVVPHIRYFPWGRSRKDNPVFRTVAEALFELVPTDDDESGHSRHWICNW